ncbi:MAG: rod shape-determining protein MreC [Oscillospiraceae bacterium]|jgi:rod shape-determining protein MreC|nr:rod shape-determining protein MreC [Oscillospiraceae bacterium]
MKVLLSKRNIAIIAVALILVIFTTVSINTRGTSGAMTDMANLVTVPLKRAASSIAHSFESLYGYIYEYESLVAENESLKAQIAVLRQDYRVYTAASAENERLSALLGFSTRHADHVYDRAVIITWGSSSWDSSFTLSRGSANSDIAVGDSVITETGVLIGRVTEVDTVTSTAISVIDTAFFAGALAGESGEQAVASGDFALMREGKLRLEFLPDGDDVLSGDTVVTSGKGGVFPEGLVIGEVSDIRINDTGVGYYGIIEPAADLNNVTDVFIVTDFEISISSSG